MTANVRNAIVLGLVACWIGVSGCEKAENAGSAATDQARQEAPATGRPPGMRDAEGPTDEHAIPLKATGHNSAEELQRALAGLEDEAAHHDFEMAYRFTFAARQADRNYLDALSLSQKLIGAHPDFAPAYRVLGYAQFNSGQQAQAMNSYLKAIEIDPDYGEVHYALAFMYAMGDKTAGKKHLDRATELGVADERGIGPRFYGDTP